MTQEQIDELAKDMDKAIRCLALELPEPVWNDVNKRWQNLKAGYAAAPAYDEKKIKLKLLWELIEDWQDARDENEDINEEKFSFNDIEISFYDKMEQIDPKAKDNPPTTDTDKEAVEDDTYFGLCDVEDCKHESCNGGGCWRETGYWSVCSKHSQQHREGLPQPKMKQSAIDRENSRDEDGYLPAPPQQ